MTWGQDSLVYNSINFPSCLINKTHSDAHSRGRMSVGFHIYGFFYNACSEYHNLTTHLCIRLGLKRFKPRNMNQNG